MSVKCVLKLCLIIGGFIFTSISYSILAAGALFIFNSDKLVWQAFDENGQLVRSGKASGGRAFCKDVHRGCKTPAGTYHIISKGRSKCHSSKYPLGKGGAPMPYCMFFHKNFAIHGSYELPHFNSSHGCVRVSPKDAKWLNQHFIKIGTQVVIQPY